MSEKRFSTIIRYNAPAQFRNIVAIRKIYELIDAILNHPPKEYLETSLVDDSPNHWSVRVDLDEERSKKLTESMVDQFVAALESGVLEVINNELKSDQEHNNSDA